MPRKGFVSRRTVLADSVYASDLVQKFINSMMWDGKRSTAQSIFYGAMEQVGQKANDEHGDQGAAEQDSDDDCTDWHGVHGVVPTSVRRGRDGATSTANLSAEDG